MRPSVVLSSQCDVTILSVPRQYLHGHRMLIYLMDGKLGSRTSTRSFFSSELLKDTSRVPYAALAKVFALIEATTKRLEKTALLTSFLLLVIRRRAKDDTQSLLQAVYLCINRVCYSIRTKCYCVSHWKQAMSRLCWHRTWHRREPASGRTPTGSQ